MYAPAPTSPSLITDVKNLSSRVEAAEAKVEKKAFKVFPKLDTPKPET